MNKKLSKVHKDYILKMIEGNDNLNAIKAYCEGAGFNTNKFSSPVYISKDGQLALRYRNINTYYLIKQ